MAHKRRSAAIVIIDVVGYSRLMERDEEDTIKRWDDAVRSIIKPEVERQSGRIVWKYTAGDGMLLDFVSPVRAVRCALGIQKAMVEAGETQPRERRLRLRIGINVVDMIVGRRELQGHGINVASRLEKMSEADGIIVTAAVHDLVESALAGVTFVDLGRQRFHNMLRPIRIYRVKATDGLHGGAPAARALAVQSAAAPLIAVLPLAGPPGDADAGSLVDGIRSELTASLTKMSLPTTRSGLSLPGIEVGDPITSQYHHDADIRYTVSGSLRCSGEWFRATVELVEMVSNETKWAHTFEGPRTDMFGMEDRVVQGVLCGIEPLLERTELLRALAKPLEELNSYECVARAVPLLHRLIRRDFMKAAACLRRAISMDPDNTAALAWYAWWHLLKMGQGWSTSSRQPTSPRPNGWCTGPWNATRPTRWRLLYRVTSTGSTGTTWSPRAARSRRRSI